MPDEDLGPKPDAEIEPGEPHPGGADAVANADGVDGEFSEPDPDLRDLDPEKNPAVEDALPDEMKETEDTETEATKGEGDEGDGDEGHGGNVHDDEFDITDSDQNVEGSIGVSSERVGHAGPGQQAPTGTRDNSEIELDPDADLPPEQSAGGVEVKPDPPAPKSEHSPADPRD